MATVVAGTPPGADGPPPAAEPPPGGPTATLVFGTAPANTLVRCMSDICPEKQPVMVAAGYPKIPLTAEEHKVQFEFQAPGHKTEVMEYTLRAGANTISFTLQPENVVAANVATLRYSGAPTGTTVECMSGPCPDQQVHPVTETFPEIKMSGDNETVLLRFRAPGYRTGVGRYELRRGPNLIPIELDPVPNAN
ncbi:MAG: hypothetical protein ACPG77_18930 [Nannocystaceae bacterium]